MFKKAKNMWKSIKELWKPHKVEAGKPEIIGGRIGVLVDPIYGKSNLIRDGDPKLFIPIKPPARNVKNAVVWFLQLLKKDRTEKELLRQFWDQFPLQVKRDVSLVVFYSPAIMKDGTYYSSEEKEILEEFGVQPPVDKSNEARKYFLKQFMR